MPTKQLKCSVQIQLKINLEPLGALVIFQDGQFLHLFCNYKSFRDLKVYLTNRNVYKVVIV